MEPDFSPLTLSAEDIEILLNLRKLSDKKNYEYGQHKTSCGYSEPYTSKDENMVLAHLDYSDEGTVSLFHSHTNETLFSRQDYSLLLSRNVERISVITTTGEIFSSYIGCGVIPDEDEFWSVVADIHHEVVFDMVEQHGFLDLEPRQMEINAYREIAFRIARHFK